MSWSKVLEVVFGWADTSFGLTKEQRKVKIRLKVDKLQKEDNELRKKGKTNKRLKRRQVIASSLSGLYDKLLRLE